MTKLGEGKFFKGGLGEKPNTPAPPPPKGQGGAPALPLNEPPMNTVDAYLSRKIQVTWPDAVVLKTEVGRFFVERGNERENLDIGGTFGEAKAAVVTIVKAEAARKVAE